MKTIDRLNYLFLRCTLGAAGHLPLGLLHGLASAVTWITGSVVGYRRKVVRANLRESFPGMDARGLRRIEKRFYRFLGEYFVETLRMGAMSAGEMRRRMRFEGMEEVDAILRQGRDVTFYLGHYGNWEWVSSIPLHLSTPIAGGEVYHPLRNKGFDLFFKRMRERFDTSCVAMHHTLRWLMERKREGKVTAVGYIADQAPKYVDMHCFVDFLNHDTPAITGAEKIARALHSAVFYIDIRQERRGYYVGKMEKMADDAATLEPFALTRDYFRRMEATIRRAPHMWLWSHRRWKRTREGLLALYGEEETARRLRRL